MKLVSTVRWYTSNAIIHLVSSSNQLHSAAQCNPFTVAMQSTGSAIQSSKMKINPIRNQFSVLANASSHSIHLARKPRLPSAEVITIYACAKNHNKMNGETCD